MKIAIKGVQGTRDLGLAGFINEEFSGQITLSISIIEQYSERLGSTAANLLIDPLTFENKGKT